MWLRQLFFWGRTLPLNLVQNECVEEKDVIGRKFLRKNVFFVFMTGLHTLHRFLWQLLIPPHILPGYDNNSVSSGFGISKVLLTFSPTEGEEQMSTPVVFSPDIHRKINIETQQFFFLFVCF